MASITWAANASGNWDRRAFWSGRTVPGAADTVTLTSANPCTIFYSTTDSIAGLTSTDDALTIAGGALTLAGDADFGGKLTESGGTLSLQGTTNTFGTVAFSAGTFALGTGDALNFNGPTRLGSGSNADGAFIYGAGTINSAGTVSIVEDGGNTELWLGGGIAWINAGRVNDAGIVSPFYNAGTAFTITNLAGAVFNFTTDVACLMNGMVDVNGTEEFAGSSFNNAGLIEKTGGTGTTTFYCVLDNTGTIAVKSGTLALEGGGTIGGRLQGTGVLNFASGSFALAANVAEHLDQFELAGSTVEIAGAISAAQTIAFTSPSTLAIDAAASFNATLSGLDAGDTLDFTNLQNATAAVSGTTLTVTAEDGTVFNVNINSLAAGVTISTAPDNGQGTDVSFIAESDAHHLITLGPSSLAASGMKFLPAAAAPAQPYPFAAATLAHVDTDITANHSTPPETGYLSLSDTHSSFPILATHAAVLPHSF
jgi:hypothetical protein